MKKITKIVPLVLIVAALLTSACGCNSEHINTNPSDQTKESSSVEETGNTHIEGVDTSKLTFAKTCDHIDFYYDEDSQWYAYIESWGQYRKLGNIKGDIYDALLGENTIEAIFTDFGYEKETIVTTIKLTRHTDKVESIQSDFDFTCSGYDCLLMNYYDENCVYFFYLPQFWVDIYEREFWPMLRYETTDGGKTWKDCHDEPHISTHHWNNSPKFLKFVDKKVGIFSHRDPSDDGCDRIYITTDSGKTWSPIAKLEYPFDLYDPHKSAEETGYTYVNDFKYEDDQYMLTITHRFHPKSGTVENTYKYVTTDFQSWTLVQ